MAKKKHAGLIHVTPEQQKRMAEQEYQKLQAFIGEANQIQARRCEVMVALLAAEVTKNGIASVTSVEVEKCRQTAHLAVEADAKQKFGDLKALFAELHFEGPQPHLEWAAKQLGITLFDEEPESTIIKAEIIGASH